MTHAKTARGSKSILVVEDDRHMVQALEMLLAGPYEVATALTGSEALDLAERGDFDLALLDIMLPDISGLDVLRGLRKTSPDTDAIMVTAVQQVKDAVAAMKLGAYDYIEKPFERAHLLGVVEKVFERQHLRRAVAELRSEVSRPYRIENIVGDSPAMRDVFQMCRKMCASDVNVLIHGESGTGKELVARAIHYNGQRSDGPFVAVNCACIPEHLLESELFGHERGAFTGAERLHRGRFELADGGTLFLDEIGNMPLALQAKLLRVIEEMRFERLGGEAPVQVDVRLLSATNADLLDQIGKGLFREDLFYRLKVVDILLPPLRHRKQDIPDLVRHFIEAYRRKTGKRIVGWTEEVMAWMLAYDWPGNVRELQNTVERCLVLAESDRITADHLPAGQDFPCAGGGACAGEGCDGSLRAILDQVERRTIEDRLEACGWNKAETARSLGVHRNTIENKIRRYGLAPHGESSA